MRRAAAWSMNSRPLVLTANCLSQLASVISRIGAISKMPALLTRMSIPPARCTTSATAASIEALLGDVEPDRERAAADLVGQCRGLGLEQVGHDHPRTLVGVAAADRGADAARPAGDDRDLVLELHARSHQQV